MKPIIQIQHDKNKTVSGDLYIDIEVMSIEDSALPKVSKSFFEFVSKKVKEEVPHLLTYASFLGEAEEYMSNNGIPYSPKTRSLYAEAIYADFISHLDDLITFDEEEGNILISPYIISLEYGDFYRPALNFISKSINEWIEEARKEL